MSPTDVKAAYQKDPSLLPELPCASILDLGSNNTAQIWSTITYKDFHRPETQAAEVDRFISHLHSCGPEAHSRLLVLNNDRLHLRALLYGPDGDSLSHDEFVSARSRFAAVQDLFIAHILGIEYNLPLSEVHRKLGQVYDDDLNTSSLFGLGYTHDDMLFYIGGPPDDGKKQILRAQQTLRLLL